MCTSPIYVRRCGGTPPIAAAWRRLFSLVPGLAAPGGSWCLGGLEDDPPGADVDPSPASASLVIAVQLLYNDCCTVVSKQSTHCTPMPPSSARARDCSTRGGAGVFLGKFLVALAGKVRVAVAAKFPIIPKGHSGSVYPLFGTPS